MNGLLRRLRGVVGIGFSWGAAWTLIGAGIGIVRIFRGTGLGLGWQAELINASIPMAVTGFLCGVGFGGILAFAERRKVIHDLSLGRMAVWGVLGSAVIPVLSGSFELIVITGPLGALFASTSLVIARKGELRNANNAALSNATGRALESER